MTIDHDLLSKASSSLKHYSPKPILQQLPEAPASKYCTLLVGTLVFIVVKQSHPRAAGPQHKTKLIMWNNLQTQGKTNIYRSKSSAGQLLPYT